MSTHEQSRRAHELVDAIKDGYTPDRADVDFLRSFLPEPPKQMTLKEITDDVYKARIASSGDEWIRDGVVGSIISLEDWLTELHAQLKGIAPAKPAHPEFLEIEADYRNAPFGTIVVGKNYYPWTKTQSSWLAYGAQSRNDFEMRACRRYVLRWGDKE